MRKLLFAAIIGMGGAAYATEFSSLSINVPDLQEAAKSVPFTSDPVHAFSAYNDRDDWRSDQQAREIRRAFQEVVEHTHGLLAHLTPTWKREHCRKEVRRNLIWLNDRDLRSLNRVIDEMEREGRLHKLRTALRRLSRADSYLRIRTEARALKRKVRKLSD